MNYLSSISHIGIVTFLIDRISKWFVVHYITQSHAVTCWFTIEKTFNRGIVWGAFNYESTFAFMMITSCIIVSYMAIAYFLWYQVKSTLEILGYVLVLVGGLSNILDRIIYHGVVDFIACSYANYHWPTFNIADAAIVIGAFLIFTQLIMHE